MGVIDILVNNAGIIQRIPMLETTAADYRKIIDIDLTGPFIMSKAVLPSMIKKGHGKIINICSMMSELGRETVVGYASAKGGLKMLTKTSVPNLVKPTFNVTVSAQVTSLPHKPHHYAKDNQTAHATHSINSSSPKPLPLAGEPQKILQALQYSYLLTPQTSSMVIFYTLMAVSWRILVNSRKHKRCFGLSENVEDREIFYIFYSYI